MERRFQVKGSSIRTKVAFARARFGERAEQSLIEALGEAGVSRVLEGGWYDFEAYEAVLVRLAEVCYGGKIDRLREVGTFSAEQALSTTYQAFAQHRDLARFLAVIPEFHKRLHSHGDLEIIGPEAGELHFQLRRLPKLSRPDHYVSEGFFLGAVRLLGWPDASSRQQPLDDGLEVIVAQNARDA